MFELQSKEFEPIKKIIKLFTANKSIVTTGKMKCILFNTMKKLCANLKVYL